MPWPRSGRRRLVKTAPFPYVSKRALRMCSTQRGSLTHSTRGRNDTCRVAGEGGAVGSVRFGGGPVPYYIHWLHGRPGGQRASSLRGSASPSGRLTRKSRFGRGRAASSEASSPGRPVGAYADPTTPPQPTATAPVGLRSNKHARRQEQQQQQQENTTQRLRGQLQVGVYAKDEAMGALAMRTPRAFMAAMGFA
jgi:hypothetical protein